LLATLAAVWKLCRFGDRIAAGVEGATFCVVDGAGA
jgi:hypothetical protein